jgi:hypothetical protein
MIHAAAIVASYGPFRNDLRFCFVVVDLLPMKNKAKMDLNIQEITYINEMALTIDSLC